MSETVLTIAFPTLNRATSLEKVLSNISEIIISADLADDVAVLISDNNSGDRTPEIVRAFTTKFPFIRSLRTDHELSFDENVLNCFESATSRFLWVCNDHSGFIGENVVHAVRFIKTHGKANSFFYAPNEGNLMSARDLCRRSKYGVAFANTLINCSIFDRVSVLPFYRSFMNDYNGSWSVFMAANLQMLFSLRGEVILIPYECTRYGQFADESRQRNSWSSDWKTYVSVGSHNARILVSFVDKYQLPEKEVRAIFRNRGWGFDGVNRYKTLRLSNIGVRYNSEIATQICTHPSYSLLERVLLTVFVSGDEYVVRACGLLVSLVEFFRTSLKRLKSSFFRIER